MEKRFRTYLSHSVHSESYVSSFAVMDIVRWMTKKDQVAGDRQFVLSTQLILNVLVD